MTFGEYIKSIRVENSLSLREVARRSDISHPYLSQLENGKNTNPTPDIIRKLAKGLNIGYLDLLQEAGYVDEADRHRRMARAFKEINDKDQERTKDTKIEDVFLDNYGFVDTTDKRKSLFIPEKFKLDGEIKTFENKDFFNLYNLISMAVDRNNLFPFTNSKGEKIDVEELKKLLPIIKSLYN